MTVILLLKFKSDEKNLWNCDFHQLAKWSIIMWQIKIFRFSMVVLRNCTFFYIIKNVKYGVWHFYVVLLFFYIFSFTYQKGKRLLLRSKLVIEDWRQGRNWKKMKRVRNHPFAFVCRFKANTVSPIWFKIKDAWSSFVIQLFECQQHNFVNNAFHHRQPL